MMRTGSTTSVFGVARLPTGGDSARPSHGGSRNSGAPSARAEAGAAHLCTFVVGHQRFALSTSLVRELVEVTLVTRVPCTDGAVLGLFSLRGEPMPLVDMGMLLGTGPCAASEKKCAIILRSDAMAVGARIDALGTVVSGAALIPSTDPTPLLLGFLPTRSSEEPVAVINGAELLARLHRLKRTTSER